MRIALRIATCAMLALALVGCTGSAPASAGAGKRSEQSLDLKLYPVPAAKAESAVQALQNVFSFSNDVRITHPFPGTIMVLAPESMQPSVERAIDEAAKLAGDSSSNEPASVPLSIRFWLVQAKAGDGEINSALTPLMPTLKQIGGTLGPSHFVLDDTAATLVDAANHPDKSVGNGAVATARGHTLAFHAEVVKQGVALNVHFTTAAQDSVRELNTTITVKPGDYVVLAEAAPAAVPASQADATLMNLLVVRVDRADTSKH